MKCSDRNSPALWIGLALIAAAAIFAAITARAEDVTVGWNWPKFNTCGSPCTNLVGAHVYYGVDSNAYDHVLDVPATASLAAVTITGLVCDVTYYFAAKAYNTHGNESAYSPVLLRCIESYPMPVTEFRFLIMSDHTVRMIPK